MGMQKMFKNRNYGLSFLLFLLVMVIGGCRNIEQSSTPVMLAKYTAIPLKLDGRLEEPAWQTATVYHLALSQAQLNRGKKLTEPGEVRIVWDDKFLYLGIKFYDSDIKARGTRDQLYHYKYGDVVELFLKPENQTWYWEFYATPHSRKSSFWLPRHKKGLTRKEIGLQVAAYCEGSLNNSRDKDQFWSVEMAVPIKKIASPEQPFKPGEKWRILVARYNHKRYLRHAELSMTPQLSKADYHRHQEYGILQLVE